MASPEEQHILVDSDGNPVSIDTLVEKLSGDTSRVLADDSIGLVLYVGDLHLYELVPLESGDYQARPVTQISRPRFPTRMLRKQIGARVISVTADAVFVILDGKTPRKVRAEKLKPGMRLASGEKVFR